MITRARLALAAVMVAALLPAIGILNEVVNAPRVLQRRDDPVSRFERHVAPLRQALQGVPVVGYLAPPAVVDRTAHLYSVRYALAPIQVRDDLDPPLVVADGLSEGAAIPPRLRVERDLGDGLFLLGHEP